MIYRILLTLFLFSNIFGQEDFSEGPYGINYFDTAGPFTVQDLNSPVSNLAEQIEYRNKRALWYEGYMANAAHTTCFEELYTAVEAL